MESPPAPPIQRRLLLVALAGLTLSTALTLNLVFKKPNHSSPAQPSAIAVSSYKPEEIRPITKVVFGSPVLLRIPAINVDAALDYVSLTSQGELGVPAGPNTAAWYDRGPRPGQPGNAVIDGHFGYKNNIPAIFDNLHKLQPGDSIFVVDDRGATTTFVVSSLQMYDQNASESSVFSSADGKSHLNLITCQGIWNQNQKSYSNRLVVFADKVT